LYLVAIVDWAARKKYGKPEIMITDQGNQYTGPVWITTLTKADIKISMDGRGRYLDNIFIERLWRSLKQEVVYLHEITDGFHAKRIINNWIRFYNSERPHIALDKRLDPRSSFAAIDPN
jgi:putative transposase